MKDGESKIQFSKRYGHATEPPITVRNEAPKALRHVILQIAKDDCGLYPSTLRNIVCRVLHRYPDKSNWSEYPNIWNEVQSLTFSCEWFHVYDIVEAIWNYLAKKDMEEPFVKAVNQCFCEMGIGWQLRNGVIQVRGEEVFETFLDTVHESLAQAELPTASIELKEAIRDMSRRPDPDLSGAVHHAMAALECVVRKVTGTPKSTLGEIIRKTPGLVPRPLDDVIEKCWGYSSEVARHGREGRNLSLEEVQLLVGLSAALSNYLSMKIHL